MPTRAIVDSGITGLRPPNGQPWWFVLPFCAIAICLPATARPADASDAITATVRAFHDALAHGDASGALRLLAPDAVILESGARETREEYRAHHLPADIQFAQAVPIQRSAMLVTVDGDAAWVSSTSAMRGSFRGRPVNSTGAELMVLTRAGAGWLIRAIHWSSRSATSPTP